MAMNLPNARTKTDANLMSLEAYQAVLWILCALCTLTFLARLYVRIQCFQRLLVDDLVMILALVLLLSIATLAQVFLADVYKLTDIENGKVMPDATLPDITVNGLRGIGATIILAVVGIVAVKINFLLFFKRLGTQITIYLVFWYAVLSITVAYGAVTLGLFSYDCVFGSFEHLSTTCSQRSRIQQVFDLQIISVVLDIISDLFIMCFPIMILWNVRISLRKKLILTCTFALVLFTIAVTVVRGGIFSSTFERFHANERVNLSPSWALFWHFIEFAVAFLVACLVSFRALFARQEQKSHESQMQHQRLEQERRASEPSSGERPGLLTRTRLCHDSLLQTFRSLESGHEIDPREPATGNLNTTFANEIRDNCIVLEKSSMSSASELNGQDQV